MGLAEIDKDLGSAPAKTGLSAIDADLAKPEPKAKQEKYGPAREQSDQGNAIADTLGLSGRKGARTPVDVVLRPENVGELMTREAVFAPLTAASLPLRIGAQGVIGAAERLTAGKGLDDAGLGGLIDAAVAGFTEGTLGLAGKAASKVAKPLLESRVANEAMQRGFKYATEAPQAALDAIAHRLPGAKVLIPSIDATKKITFQEAIEKLAEMEGGAYKQARAEIAHWMKWLDKQVTPKPNAGAVFKSRTSPERFAPPAAPKGTAAQRSAEQVANVTDSGVTRSIADTAMTAPADESTGLPIGGMPLMKAIHGAGDAWQWLKHLHP